MISMANSNTNLPLLLLLLIVVVLASPSRAAVTQTFVVQGRVYCDNCRAGFETTITEYVEDAKVRLECRNITSQELLHQMEASTDSTGMYMIEVADDREEEICEVALVSSPVEDCNEIKEGRDRASVVITDNSGMTSNVRYPNSLGFMRKEPLDICGELLAQYSLGEDEF